MSEYLRRINSNTVLYIAMILAMTAWGGSWPAGKIIADSIQPEVLIFWRFSLTFISFFPVMFAFKKSFKLDWRSAGFILLGGIFLISYNKFYFLGLRYGLAGAGGVLVTTLNPILTFIFTIILFRKKVSSRELLGIVLGLTGGMFLLQIWAVNFHKLVQSGNLFFVIAAFSWASVSIVSDKSKNYMSPIVFSFYVYGVAAFIDLFFALKFDMMKVFTFGAAFWLSLVYLSLLATTFATTVYFIAAGRLGSRKASAFIFMVPVSAVFLSWLLLSEKPGLYTIIGGLIGITAVYLINFRIRTMK